MNVSLTPELEKLVQSEVETGRYASASEVVSEALRLLQARDSRTSDLRHRIEQSLASQQAGRLLDGDAVFARIEAELNALED